MEQTLRIALVSTGFALLAMGHGYVTRSHLRAGISFNLTEKHVSDQLRFNEALFQARLLMVKKVAATLFHFLFLLCLTTLWKWLHEPCLSSLFQVAAGICCYSLQIFAHRMVQTEYHFRAFEAITVASYVLFSLGIANETDLVMFDVGERVSLVGAICGSIALIDVKVTLPLHACQSAILTYCRWKLIGFEQLTFYVTSLHVISNIVFCGVLAICIHHIQSLILAQLDSGDASSLVSGFRQVLRGVCDGDVVLNRSTMMIVDDASCLERVLKSNRKLHNSNFLDLFLDSESRKQFSEFLAQEPSCGVPRGLRVSLQGSRGSVSMDLFSTTLPTPGPPGPALGTPGCSRRDEFCLLAIKEDPESVPPEAPPNSAPQIQHSATTRTRSSVSDLVMASDDLVEIALLLSDATEFLDIEQVHLSFQRKSDVCNIEGGMPTMRRFIRPSDWERIEKMLDVVTNLDPADQGQRCHFQRPTLFRVPGESRSYLCAKSTSLRLADPCLIPGRPAHYWLHLSQFDSSQIQRTREQELEGIQEE